jgi:hypothetical protein
MLRSILARRATSARLFSAVAAVRDTVVPVAPPQQA